MPGPNVARFHTVRSRLLEERAAEAEAFAEDVEWINPPDAVEPGTRRGVDQFVGAIESVFEGWEESRFEVEQVIEQGDDVIALGTLRTRGRTGLEAAGEHGEVWSFDGVGRVTRMAWFNTHAETLAAAGVAEGDG